MRHLALLSPTERPPIAIPSKGPRGDGDGALAAQIRIHPALHDPEQCLVRSRGGLEASLGPAVCPLHGDGDLLDRQCRVDQLIEAIAMSLPNASWSRRPARE